MLALRCSPQVRAEHREQHHGVVPGQPPGEGDHQRIEAGCAEEGQVEPPRLAQLYPARLLAAPPQSPGKQQHHQGPPQPQQQPIAAGHVSRTPGEVEVDRVLGQDGDDSEDRGRQAARDVAVSGLGSPHQQEGRRHHGAAEHGDGNQRRQVDIGDSQPQRRQSDAECKTELPPS